MVDKKNWMTDEEYLNGLALAQLLPEAPTVNLNTYIGYFLRGFPGALVASIFFVIPCFVAMVVLAHLYLNYNDVPLVSSLFKGVGALVVGLVLNTIIDLWKKGVNIPHLTILAAGGFVMVYFLKANIFALLLAAGAVSLVFAFLASIREIIRHSGYNVIRRRQFTNSRTIYFTKCNHWFCRSCFGSGTGPYTLILFFSTLVPI